jgi:hypothetical protein
MLRGARPPDVPDQLSPGTYPMRLGLLTAAADRDPALALCDSTRSTSASRRHRLRAVAVPLCEAHAAFRTSADRWE